MDSLEVRYCEKWQADLEWMSNVQLITLAVNVGGNGLSEREGYFSAIKKEWGLT